MSYRNGTSSRRNVLKVIGAGGLTAVAGCLGGDNGNDGNPSDTGGSWSIGTSSEGTMAFAAGTAYAEVVSEYSDELEASAETTGGTASNPPLASQGEIQAGTTSSPLVRAVNEQLPPFEEGFEQDMVWTQCWVSHTLDFHLVRLDNNELDGMETVHDLPQDIDISFGQAAGTQFDVTMEVLELAGIDNPQDHFENIHDIDVASQAEALREGRVDVAMPYTTNLSGKVGWVQELDATVDLQFVTFGLDPERVAETDIPVELGELDPDLYDQDMEYPGQALVTPYDLSVPHFLADDEVYEFVSTCMDNYEEVRTYHDDLEFFGPEYGTENLLTIDSAPVHPGAEEYYKENDYWYDEITTLDEFQS